MAYLKTCILVLPFLVRKNLPELLSQLIRAHRLEIFLDLEITIPKGFGFLPSMVSSWSIYACQVGFHSNA